MKLHLIIAFILLACTSVSAQSDDPSNELKLNLFYTAFSYPEIGYERLFSNQTGAGISAGFGDNNNPVGFKYTVTPYYRVFFGKKKANGFFIGVHSMLFEDNEIYYRLDEETKKTGLTIGMSIGGKFVFKGGWIAEVYLGGGRPILSSNYGFDGYSRMGIQFGKRF